MNARRLPLAAIAAVVVLVAVVAMPASVFAGPAPAVVEIGALRDPFGSGDPSVLSAREARIDVSALAAIGIGDEFDMVHPVAGRLTVVVEDVLTGPGVERTIRGRVAGRAGSAATFVVNPGVVSGVVVSGVVVSGVVVSGFVSGVANAPGLGTWRIRPGGVGGGHVLLEVDPARLPECAGTAPAAEALPRAAQASGGFLCEDGSRIDVLIFYTPLARIDAGGEASIENEINLGVIAANEAYANSGIGLEVRVVGLQEIAYDESTNYSGHLSRLTDPADGYMDEAHVLREELAADLVALIVRDGENCGIAWLMPSNDTDSEDRGFSVTTWYCAADLVLAHELGHNMGACHAPGDGGGCNGGGLFEYSVGYRYFGNSGTQWRTVMAYSPGSRMAHFSNPEVEFDGRPTGDGTSNNGLTLNQTAQAIANYRRPPCAGNAYDDCAVNFNDILKLLANWGASGGRSDVNDDGTVDVRDILFVLQHWGPCSYE